MIKKIAIDGLLSFDKFELELRNLNVLIGPNGSGKSNLIEVLSLLQALPTDLGEPIRRGGGVGAWMRKLSGLGTASLRTEITITDQTLRHEILLSDEQGRLRIPREQLAVMLTGRKDTLFTAYEIQHGEGSFAAPGPPDDQGLPTAVAQPLSLKSATHSALAELRWQNQRWELQAFALFRNMLLDGMRFYCDLGLGKDLAARQWQPADQPVDFLEEDTTNLALVVQNQFVGSDTESALNGEFRRFFERFQRFTVSIFGNQVLLNMHEDGLAEPVPATRWSDGMLRYLSLLVILLHPTPPPLICIDEPEVGLHPDILPDLARLIKDASERTQIIITTHSKDLVDGFTDDAGSVVVCERGFDGETTMERLDAKRLDKWLEHYSLGDLWRSGEIGGNLY